MSRPQVIDDEEHERVHERVAADGSRWATSAVVVPLPGVWTLTLHVALGPADAYATSASYRVW